MIQARHRPIPSCHWLGPRQSWLYELSSICNHAAKYEVATLVTLVSQSRGKPLSLSTMNNRAVSFTTLFSDYGASQFEWPLWFPLIMECSGIGDMWWKIYPDSTLNHIVSGEAYARATGGHLQGTITSNTITSTALITAVTSFFTEVESLNIRDKR